MTDLIVGSVLAAGCIYTAFRIARSDQWLEVLMIFMAVVMFLSAAAESRAWGSFDGGWGTNAGNIYEGSGGRSFGGVPQFSGGWSSFFGGMFNFGGGGGGMMGCKYQ
jgi:hypothetical protein